MLDEEASVSIEAVSILDEEANVSIDAVSILDDELLAIDAVKLFTEVTEFVLGIMLPHSQVVDRRPLVWQYSSLFSINSLMLH